MQSVRQSLMILCVAGLVAVLPQRLYAAQSTEHLLKLIGFDAFVSGLAQSFQDSDNAMAQSDEGFGVAWDLAARQVFPSKEMFEDITGEIDGTLEPAEIEEMVVFFETGLGQKVTEMEVAAQTGESAHLLEPLGAEILAKMIETSDPRLEKYTAMVDALGVVDSQVATAMNINFAIMTGMAASGKLPYEMSEAEILGNIAAQHDLIRADIQNSVYVTFAFTYQDLSDGELDDYIAFLTSDNGRALYSSINRATETVLNVRAHAFGARLMDLQGVKEL